MEQIVTVGIAIVVVTIRSRIAIVVIASPVNVRIVLIVAFNLSPPILHHLRFTFAIMVLEKMDTCRQNLYTTLPILYKYLGHKNIEATEHYLMLAKDYFINILYPDTFLKRRY